MNAKRTLLAVLATLTVGAAQAEAPIQGWVSHAEAVFASADAENLAMAAELASRSAWVAQAEAVFAAADAENLAIARMAMERMTWVSHADAVFKAADEHNLSIAGSLESDSARQFARAGS